MLNFKTVLTTVIILLSINSSASWDVEKKKINYLIHEVSKIEGTFIRNDKSYSPKEASGHLRRKLKNAQKSLFAPRKSKWTAKLFIEKIATESSMSGKKYKIKFKDGTVVMTKPWLMNKLNTMPKK